MRLWLSVKYNVLIEYKDRQIMPSLIYFASIISYVWWGGNRSFPETIPTLHWRPDDRPTKGVTPIPCYEFSCSRCEPIGEAGCAIFNGIELKLYLTVLGIGVDRVEILHPVKGAGGSSGSSLLDREYTQTLSPCRLVEG